MRRIVSEQFSKAKIRDFWDEILIKKYVASLDVPMNDMRADFFMEITKSPRNA